MKKFSRSILAMCIALALCVTIVLGVFFLRSGSVNGTSIDQNTFASIPDDIPTIRVYFGQEHDGAEGQPKWGVGYSSHVRNANTSHDYVLSNYAGEVFSDCVGSEEILDRVSGGSLRVCVARGQNGSVLISLDNTGLGCVIVIRDDVNLAIKNLETGELVENGVRITYSGMTRLEVSQSQ